MVSKPLLIIAAAMLCASCSEQGSDDSPTPVAPASMAEAAQPMPEQSAEEMSAEQAEVLYLQRFSSLTDTSSRSGLSLYDPMVPVSGTNDWQPLPKSESPVISDQALAEVTQYAAANNSSALLVWHDNALALAHYFDDNDASTLINSRSLAKPLSVIAVGRAIAEGAIANLDQPVADYIEEWQGTPKAKITIRDLLAMRSGLLPQGPAPEADNILNRAYLHPFHERVLIEEYPLVNEPGERYDYANANSELVAPLLERATGVPYEEWLGRQVLAPIGAKGGEIWMNRPDGTPHSGCCVMLPAEDFLRLAILLLQDGVWDGVQLLPEGFVDQMRTPLPQNIHAGLGLYIGSPYTERRGALNPDLPFGQVLHSEPYLADDLVLFDGNSNQVAYIVPSAGLVLLRTGNWAKGEQEWDNSVLPNTVLRALAQ